MSHQRSEITPAQWRLLTDLTKANTIDPFSGLYFSEDVWFRPKWRRSIAALERSGLCEAEYFPNNHGRAWITTRGINALLETQRKVWG